MLENMPRAHQHDDTYFLKNRILSLGSLHQTHPLCFLLSKSTIPEEHDIIILCVNLISEPQLFSVKRSSSRTQPCMECPWWIFFLCKLDKNNYQSFVNAFCKQIITIKNSYLLWLLKWLTESTKDYFLFVTTLILTHWLIAESHIIFFYSLLDMFISVL